MRKILMVLICLSTISLSHSQTKVLKLTIDSEIDPRVSRYVEVGLQEAKDKEYDIVLIEMDTYGGLVTEAKNIVELLLDFEKPVYVWINKDAASAGALISIACDSIYMAPGASIGAATVVTGQGETALDKHQSYMRATMRATAEKTGRDPYIAEAMVDQSIEIEGITKPGKVLTFTTSEAIKYGFCEGEKIALKDILNQNFNEDYRLDEFKLNFFERIAIVFLSPYLSGLLLMIIIGGIYFELQTPGVGFPILASLIAIILYFVPYYLVGLAAHWEIILFFIGILLITIEIFVLPGFGIAGILGTVLTISALVLVMLNNTIFDFTFVSLPNIITAVTTIITAVLSSFIIMIIAGVRLANSRVINRVALTLTQKKSEGFTARFHDPMIGKEGITQTILRPSGRVLIGGVSYDSITRGDLIERGKKICVIDEEANTLIVRKM